MVDQLTRNTMINDRTCSRTATMLNDKRYIMVGPCSRKWALLSLMVLSRDIITRRGGQFIRVRQQTDLQRAKETGQLALEPGRGAGWT